MSGIPRHSAAARAAAQDLLTHLQAAPQPLFRGVPSRVDRGGRAYWYDTYRIGSAVKKVYLGEDGDELRARLQPLEREREDRQEQSSRGGRLVRLLKAEGMLSVDGSSGALVAALAAAGVFSLDVTLVGTAAFRLYDGMLGFRHQPAAAAWRGELDLLAYGRIALAIDDVASPALQKALAGFVFDPLPSLRREKTWRWRQSRRETLAGFLTPAEGDDEPPRAIDAIGAYAEPLHALDYLVADAIAAALPYRDGVLVRVPRPERFAIHKLIVSDRHRYGLDSPRAVRDRRQAAALVAVLAEDRPDDLRLAMEDARARGQRWRERLDQALARVPDVARLLNR